MEECMNQLDIEFRDVAPLARRRDPATSHLAAQSAVELAKAHYTVILTCLRKHGALGKDGIAARTRLDGVAVARRLPELERKGLVKQTGNTVPSTSGREEREWQLA
jgi:predicted ArsR family transcriptional regulator